MLSNYLTVALRNFARHKVYSTINLAGLAIGMACCILILLWVRNETTYDRFHEKIEQLFLVGTMHQYGTQITPSRQSPPALGPILEQDYPEIVRSARYLGMGPLLVSYRQQHFRESGARLVDPSFLEMFTFPLLRGDPATALADPHSIVMTRETAAKFFGDQDPIGNVLKIDNRYEVVVTGILEDLPHNTRFPFNMLIPMEFFREWGWGTLDNWYDCGFVTFVELRESADADELSARIAGRVKQAVPESPLEPFLTPWVEVHMHGVGGRGGRIGQVRMMTLLALLILLIACINFMNLTTARSGNRAREVGMRKVLGAQRGQLVRQFLCESLFQSAVALLLAMALAELLLPLFNALCGKQLKLGLLADPAVPIGILLITLVTGLAAGSYPALILSSFRPARVLQGMLAVGARGSWFRRLLVVLQFTFAIALMISTSVVYDQHMFMKNKDLGFDREQVLYLPLTRELNRGFAAIKTELLKTPDVLSVTWSTHSPAGVYWNGQGHDWQGRSPDTDPMVTYLGVGFDYPETLGIEVSEGRFFSRDLDAGSSDRLVINETFAAILGFDSPVGEGLRTPGVPFELTVVGVVRDFHFKPLYQPIEPLIMVLRPDEMGLWDSRGYLFAKLGAGGVGRTLGFIEQTWTRVAPDLPFEYHFLDEDFESLYREEQRVGGILRSFALLAIVISCLGLFGLAAFMAEQRTKEVGIRKIFGATVAGIVFLMAKEFTRWVLVANLFAWPLAYFTMSRWLENFAYRTDIGVTRFVAAAGLAFVIALATVSAQALKAATSNPARAIRYE